MTLVTVNTFAVVIPKTLRALPIIRVFRVYGRLSLMTPINILYEVVSRIR